VKTSRTFESIGDEWLAGVKAGRISRRKGRGKPYSPTTLRDYASAYRNFLRPEFGPFPADDIGELEWQMWCDRLSREGLSDGPIRDPRFRCDRLQRHEPRAVDQVHPRVVAPVVH
jgi:hypothetical protein